MKKKENLPKLKRKLWKVFSQYIRKRDKGRCFTCPKVRLKGRLYHSGHFLPKKVSGLELYFHEDNVHGQCAGCNLAWQGHQYLYGKKLGDEKTAELFALIGKGDWSAQDYLDKIELYKNKI